MHASCRPIRRRTSRSRVLASSPIAAWGGWLAPATGSGSARRMICPRARALRSERTRGSCSPAEARRPSSRSSNTIARCCRPTRQSPWRMPRRCARCRRCPRKPPTSPSGFMLGTSGTNDGGSCAWDNADEAHPEPPVLTALATSQPDLQLVPAVIDDEHIEGSEQIHPERQCWLVGQLPVLEQIHVTEGDAHAVNGEVTEVDIGCGYVVTPLHVERHADDVLVCRVARRMSHQGPSQHEIADGPLGTGVDDGLGAHRAHAHEDIIGVTLDV